jgi:hypothetical protein
MQAIFGSTLTAARSSSLDRKLRLLQCVLPIFFTAAHPTREKCKRWSPDRKFWTQFITPCLLISDAEWSFDKVGDEHAVLIEDVLRGLEHMIHSGEARELQPVRETLYFEIAIASPVLTCVIDIFSVRISSSG